MQITFIFSKHTFLEECFLREHRLVHKDKLGGVFIVPFAIRKFISCLSERPCFSLVFGISPHSQQTMDNVIVFWQNIRKFIFFVHNSSRFLFAENVLNGFDSGPGNCLKGVAKIVKKPAPPESIF